MSAGAVHPPRIGAALHPRRRLLYGGIPAWCWASGVLLAVLLDRVVFLNLATLDPRTLAIDHAARQSLENQDWFRMLRICGWLGTWIIVGAALMAIDLARSRAGAAADAGAGFVPGHFTRRGVLLITCAFFSGLAAEGAKGAIGMRRPELTLGWPEFVPLAQRIEEWNNLGMPSSHAAVAFGAAMALSLKHPAAAPLFLALAAGCGLTRVLTGAHFFSDIIVAAWIAYAVSILIWRIDARNNGGLPLGEPLGSAGGGRAGRGARS